MHTFRPLVISTIICTQLLFASCQEGDQFHSITSAWETFWTVSCEFTDLLTSSSRSKRSAHQEPNLDDPVELFNYLYPLADVGVEDFIANEQRSGSGSSGPSLSMLIQDLVDLWGAECHSRTRTREKRDANYEDEIIDEEGPYENYTKNNTLKATTSAPPPAVKKKDKKAIADADTFFAQYGGDIEYFFPLISFGIPFDGEITFLGFHGFKGLFPYK